VTILEFYASVWYQKIALHNAHDTYLCVILQPFWKVTRDGSSVGNGVVGMLALTLAKVCFPIISVI